jgi:hypothetical protein
MPPCRLVQCWSRARQGASVSLPVTVASTSSTSFLSFILFTKNSFLQRLHYTTLVQQFDIVPPRGCDWSNFSISRRERVEVMR